MIYLTVVKLLNARGELWSFVERHIRRLRLRLLDFFVLEVPFFFTYCRLVILVAVFPSLSAIRICLSGMNKLFKHIHHPITVIDLLIRFVSLVDLFKVTFTL